MVNNKGRVEICGSFSIGHFQWKCSFRGEILNKPGILSRGVAWLSEHLYSEMWNRGLVLMTNSNCI